MIYKNCLHVKQQKTPNSRENREHIEIGAVNIFLDVIFVISEKKHSEKLRGVSGIVCLINFA